MKMNSKETLGMYFCFRGYIWNLALDTDTAVGRMLWYYAWFA